MLRDALFIFFMLVASRAVLGVVCVMGERARVSAESRRKLLHVGLGVLLCGLPWVFDRAGPVIVLCGAYVGLLVARPFVAVLDRRVTGVIYGVSRRSIGEFLFPVSVAVLFVLARGAPAMYVGPLLILTLADAAAAVVGRRYGLCAYATPGGGRKSLEGSLAFALVAFASTHFVLLLTGAAGRVESVLIAACVAMALTVVEAFCVGGWDNLLVPLGAWGMMRGLGMVDRAGLVAVSAAGVCVVMGLLVVYAVVPALEVGRESVTEN